jgi:hypothetical protein
MDEEGKKRYQRPEVTRVNLDSQVAVMAACKFTSDTGPGPPDCAPLTIPCETVAAS